MSNLAINSTLIHRSIVQANLRTLAQSAARWSSMTEGSNYTTGYCDGYLDAIEQVADSIEVDAGIKRTQTQLIISG